MPSKPRRSFDRAAFEAGLQITQTFDPSRLTRPGLQRLNVAIGKSQVLDQFRPIELVASGGFVSVM